MKTIYLDKNYRCHTEPEHDFRTIETDVFDGKCNLYIESCMLVPDGESYTTEEGITYTGFMFAMIGNPSLLIEIQSAYEDGQRNILSEVEGVLGL